MAKVRRTAGCVSHTAPSARGVEPPSFSCTIPAILKWISSHFSLRSPSQIANGRDGRRLRVTLSSPSFVPSDTLRPLTSPIRGHHTHSLRAAPTGPLAGERRKRTWHEAMASHHPFPQPGPPGKREPLAAIAGVLACCLQWLAWPATLHCVLVVLIWQRVAGPGLGRWMHGNTRSALARVGTAHSRAHGPFGPRSLPRVGFGGCEPARSGQSFGLMAEQR
jgi:hypothetical protein